MLYFTFQQYLSVKKYIQVIGYIMFIESMNLQKKNALTKKFRDWLVKQLMININNE